MSHQANSDLSSVPHPSDALTSRLHGHTDIGNPLQGNPNFSSPLSQSAAQQHSAFSEEHDHSQRDASFIDNSSPTVARSASRASTSMPSRNNTLRKKSSMRRSASKKSLRAGSIKGVGGGEEDNDHFNSAFYTPIPTQGTPTEILANRFQAWRQLLKSLITYFREIQTSYETRAKATHKLQGTLANIVAPGVFTSGHGLSEASRMLENYHQRTLAESNKSREIEADVIAALSGLRSDLGQKIKEIKSLNGDFKNSVEKEKESTRREVERLKDALQHANHEDGSALGKNDPFVVRLGVDRAVEKQIDEENYLHRAYLNLESSGRELESIVVGEIQKAYNAFAGILKREGDDAFNVVELLRTGPIAMPKDQEWNSFVVHDHHFVDPSIPLRRVEDIEYPGKFDPQAAEVRAGMLERKSKYLKSYTAGWYVLSATHLHEFKSADKIYSQPPVMSLYLPDQKLGSKSDVGSSSHKFMLKGRHKGHNWVFRAESHDTMQAWYDDIHALTEKTGAERTAFVRKHARSVSGMSDRGTVSSDGMDEDEADAVPYSAHGSLTEHNNVQNRPQRPVPGGRFPSDLRIPQTAAEAQPLSPSSEGSEEVAAVAIAAAGAIPGSAQHEYQQQDPYRLSGIASHTPSTQPQPDKSQTTNVPVQTQTFALPLHADQPVNQQQPPISQPEQKETQPQAFLDHDPTVDPATKSLDRPNTSYGGWMAPAAGAAVAGAGAGALVGHEATSNENEKETVPAPTEDDGTARDIPSAPIAATAAATTAPVTPPINETLKNEAKLGGVATPVAAYPTPTPGSPAGAAAITPASGTPSAAPLPTAALAPTSAPTTDNDNESTLSGREREGAHETGHIFPSVVRHDTDISVSRLHVPGEFNDRGA